MGNVKRGLHCTVTGRSSCTLASDLLGCDAVPLDEWFFLC